MTRASHEIHQLNEERDAWIEAIMDQLHSEKRRNICLESIDRWYQWALKQKESS
jgi:hypothetical protein